MTLPVGKQHINLVKDRVRSTINRGFPNLFPLMICTHELPRERRLHFCMFKALWKRSVEKFYKKFYLENKEEQ